MSGYVSGEDSEDESGGGKMPAVDPEAVAIATEEAAALKAQGNAAFSAQDFEGALVSYTAAVNVLKSARAPRDALILLNRSATYLALKRYVPANFDAAQAAEVDPTNWKAHWRQGVALCSMTKKTFRSKQAIEAFERCLSCGTLPEDKVAETQAALSKARQLLEQQDAETPPADLSNCMPS